MWITSKSVGTLLALVVFEYCMASATRGGYLKFEVRSDDCQKLLSISHFLSPPALSTKIQETTA